MVTGKAYSRAVRVHQLLSSALNTLIASEALSVPTPELSSQPSTLNGKEVASPHANCLPAPLPTPDKPTEEDPMPLEAIDENASSAAVVSEPISDSTTSENNSESEKANEVNSETSDAIDDLKQLYNKALTGDKSWKEVNSSESMEMITNKISTFKEKLKDSRTARLWLQYLDMTQIMRFFIWSERVGDWKLGIKSQLEMLPYLVGSGHYLYTSSLSIYINRMIDLSISKPEIYERIFRSGQYTFRISPQVRAGLSRDLVIKQCLMRAMKTNGGKTRGRGMDDSQRNV